MTSSREKLAYTSGTGGNNSSQSPINRTTQSFQKYQYRDPKVVAAEYEVSDYHEERPRVIRNHSATGGGVKRVIYRCHAKQSGFVSERESSRSSAGSVGPRVRQVDLGHEERNEGDAARNN